MKQTTSSLNRQTYEPPRAAIINVEMEGVLCLSALEGITNEAVGLGTFGWI